MKAKILPSTPENLSQVANALKNSEVAAIPTETVYGLAGSAFSSKALTRIFEAKQRPKFDPLIVHVMPENRTVSDLEKLRVIDSSKMTARSIALANQLMAAFWPGPLTLVLPKHADIPDLVTAGLTTVGVRMPKHPTAQKLIQLSGTPLAAPSANRFGKISPTSAKSVGQELGEEIEYIVDGGNCEVGLESTVVSVSGDGQLTLLRPGATTRSQIEEVTGASVSEAPPTANPASPGMQKSHYAPSTPFIVLPSPLEQLNVTQMIDIVRSVVGEETPMQMTSVGILTFNGDAFKHEMYFSGLTGCRTTILALSERGDLEEIGRNFFRGLRELDSMNLSLILSEPCPSEMGLGHAISDRLKRASQRI